MQLSEDQTIAFGDFCKSLLEHDAFNALCAQYREDQLGAMFGSDPRNDRELREHIYAKLTGVQELLVTMASLVSARDNIIVQREAPPPPPDIPDEPFDPFDGQP